METRSQARAAQHQPSQARPPFPQISTHSSPSSTFPSASSFASLPSSFGNTLYTQPPGLASAPLPSPSASQPQAYFGTLAPTSQPGVQQTQQRYAAAQQAQGHQGQLAGFVGQRGDGGGTPETAPFLKDFNLVAEAAKRAQMACLARDLGDVGI